MSRTRVKKAAYSVLTGAMRGVSAGKRPATSEAHARRPSLSTSYYMCVHEFVMIT